MYVRRNLGKAGKRTKNAFQQMFKSQNKSPLRLIRVTLIVLCLFSILVVIGYQIYSLQSIKQSSYKQSRFASHDSEIQSFMDPNHKLPSNDELRQKHEQKFMPHKEDHLHNKKALSTSMVEQLNSVKTPLNELRTKHKDIEDSDLAPYTRLSWEEECESSTFHEKHFYDHLVDEDSIDFIFPADDEELYNTLQSEEFLDHWDTSFLDNVYWKLIAKLDKEHKKDVKKLKEKYDAYNIGDEAEKKRLLSKLSTKKRSDVDQYFDFNGLTSDLTLFYRHTASTGANDNYWHTSKDCVHHKSCDVYPVNRVLQKSKVISCKEILTEILPPIYSCISKHGKKCELLIDSGYYRVILKAYYDKIGEEIVIKIMKPKSITKPRDLIRHIRESILLGKMYDLEQTYMQSLNNDASTKHRTFTQSLNSGASTKQRGFNYVEEYGHCVTPLWISISPKYKIALDKWIFAGYAAQATLKKLIFMSLQIAYSVELLHTIPGGPFHHTDIQPRQFLLDDNDNVYINDFNRGKFQPYYFDEENEGKITKCWYCGHRSRGHWRAPEEPSKKPLNEKLDIFSMGLTIWALYSNEVPFREASFDDLSWLFFDLRKIPEMYPNMPPAIKDVVRSCLSWNPRQRPTASHVVQTLESIYFVNLKTVTEGFMDKTSKQLTTQNIWEETNYPPLEKREKFPNESE